MMEWEPKKCQFLIGNVRQTSEDMADSISVMMIVSIPHR